MFQVLHELEIFEIWICQIFGFFLPPKVTSTRSNRPAERDGDGEKNKVYLIIDDKFYPLVHVIIRLDGS